LVGLAIALGVFVFAKAQVFEPSADVTAPTATGDAVRGETVFESNCAGCHGAGGTGGSGTALQGTGLEASFVTERIREGSGIMPAGLVSGQAEADVVAYVVSISNP
jgi:cytochrome c550